MKNRRAFLQESSFAGLGLLLASKTGIASNAVSFFNHLAPYKGVQIGVITYSFRSMPGSAQQILQYCKTAGITAIELMGDPAEAFAGSPAGLLDMSAFPAPKPTPPVAPAAPGAPAAAPAFKIPPEFLKMMEERNAKARTWRETASMDKFIELRKMFNDAGITIYAYKPDSAMSMKSTDAEIDFAMRAAKALGARSVTIELPEDPAHSQRLGAFALKHKVYVGYHAHTQATDTEWDLALSQSPYNSINLDCGHYIAAGGNNTKETLLAFINKHHDRITSMHIKDRLNAAHGGKNMPWGQGDTPLKEILVLLRDKKYAIPATIELEYDIPVGSDAVQETKKCLNYAQSMLG